MLRLEFLNLAIWVNLQFFENIVFFDNRVPSSFNYFPSSTQLEWVKHLFLYFRRQMFLFGINSLLRNVEFTR